MPIHATDKPRKKTYAALIVTASLLSACATVPQYTSGQNYLANYSGAPITNDIDREIRTIAAVEPDLRFPARIGLARIERGILAALPHDEAEHWRTMAENLGPSFGNFIPVSPLIASYVDKPKINKKGYTVASNTVDHIRKGAARQHLDYVLIYEVTRKDDKHSNALSFADASILGLFVIPSKTIDVSSTASAILLDVRNGYPYLTSTEFAEDSRLSISIHSRSQSKKLANKTRLNVVASLSGKIEHGIKELHIMSNNHDANQRMAELE